MTVHPRELTKEERDGMVVQLRGKISQLIQGQEYRSEIVFLGRHLGSAHGLKPADVLKLLCELQAQALREAADMTDDQYVRLSQTMEQKR